MYDPNEPLDVVPGDEEEDVNTGEAGLPVMTVMEAKLDGVDVPSEL